MNTKRRYEFLEHTADVYIAAYGKSLEEAFESAAVAFFDVITDVQTVNPVTAVTIEAQATDEFALLYSWLEALLVKFETEGMLFSKFRVDKITTRGEELALKAMAFGERYNPDKHPQRVGVKAVTYHRMEITKQPSNVMLKFILDI